MPSSLLSVSIEPQGPECPFVNKRLAFELWPAQVLWLRGPSGAGKSYTCMHLAGLASLPAARVETRWPPELARRERIGFLFQKGVLVDALTLRENIALALLSAGAEAPSEERVASSLGAVGLSYERDGHKMPGELSGGMLRRAALAQVLAQRKRLIVLDEPFVGLDPPVALEIATLISEVAKQRQVAFILVSHMEHLAKRLEPALTLELTPRPLPSADERRIGSRRSIPLWRGPLSMLSRVVHRFADYFFYSLPLIVSAFVATGAAVSMLLADLLLRLNVAQLISNFLQASMNDSPALPMLLQLAQGVVQQNEATAKRKLYALAISTVFTLELGPLLTALLLAGRIGGSYAGEEGMMAATSQLDLLRMLGVSRTKWNFVPAMAAALSAAPLLSAIGTAVGIMAGAIVGGPAGFDIISSQEYWSEAQKVIWDWPAHLHPLKYAPLVNAYRSFGFTLVTMIVAHTCGHWSRKTQPRQVPLIITSAVVLACLLVLLLDWAFSQLYVRIGDIELPQHADAMPQLDRRPGGDFGSIRLANGAGTPQDVIGISMDGGGKDGSLGVAGDYVDEFADEL